MKKDGKNSVNPIKKSEGLKFIIECIYFIQNTSATNSLSLYFCVFRNRPACTTSEII
jgi:hypothetical protein